MSSPCDQCPWRLSNQGKRHQFGFYTLANLRRLWNQIRRGGGAQSCHLTDPSHPDHVAVGAKPEATARECPGSVIVVLREVEQMANAERVVTPESMARYRSTRKKGLTKEGILFWVVSRLQYGGVPFVGGVKLPDVDVTDATVGLPEVLRHG
jgi:hypothetical protein